MRYQNDHCLNNSPYIICTFLVGRRCLRIKRIVKTDYGYWFAKNTLLTLGFCTAVGVTCYTGRFAMTIFSATQHGLPSLV